jgi:hypothetical protein
MRDKFVKVCLGVIAFCKAFEVLLELIKYAKDYGEAEEEEDEPVPLGMYS